MYLETRAVMQLKQPGKQIHHRMPMKIGGEIADPDLVLCGVRRKRCCADEAISCGGPHLRAFELARGVVREMQHVEGRHCVSADPYRQGGALIFLGPDAHLRAQIAHLRLRQRGFRIKAERLLLARKCLIKSPLILK